MASEVPVLMPAGQDGPLEAATGHAANTGETPAVARRPSPVCLGLDVILCGDAPEKRVLIPARSVTVPMMGERDLTPEISYSPAAWCAGLSRAFCLIAGAALLTALLAVAVAGLEGGR